MWEYHRPDELDDYLCHAKYIKRERVNGKWRYWYDDVKSNVSNKAKTVSSNLQKKANTASANLKKQVNSTVKDVKKQVNSKTKDIKKQVTKSYNQFEKNAKNAVVDALEKRGYNDAAREVNEQYAKKKIEQKAKSVSSNIQKKAKNTYNDIEKKVKNAATSALEKSGNKDAAKAVNKEYAKQKINSAVKTVESKAKDVGKKIKKSYNDLERNVKNKAVDALEKNGYTDAAKEVNKQYAKKKVESTAKDVEKKLAKYKDSAISEASKAADRGREYLDELLNRYRR